MIKAAVKQHAPMRNEAVYYYISIKDNVRLLLLSYETRRKFKHIDSNEMERSRIVSTSYKLKLRAVAKELGGFYCACIQFQK